MVGLQILLMCVSVKGEGFIKDRTFQPYGPQMCKALCDRKSCSAFIFDKVMLICKLHFPTVQPRLDSSKFNIHKPSQLGPNSSNNEGPIKKITKPKISSIIPDVKSTKQLQGLYSGFFVRTEINLYHFNNCLGKHRLTLKGLPLLKLLEMNLIYDDHSLYGIRAGRLYVGAFHNYTVDLRRERDIRVLKNKEIISLALDRKSKVLATVQIQSSIVLQLLLLKHPRPQSLVKKHLQQTHLYMDKQNRLVYFINSYSYISSVDYRGQNAKRYRKLNTNMRTSFEVEGDILTVYRCIHHKTLKYQYDLNSKKTLTNKFDVNLPCHWPGDIITSANMIIAETDKGGIVVKKGVSIRSFLQPERVLSILRLH